MLGNINVLSQIYTVVTLPEASANLYTIAITSDQGPVYSDGNTWSIIIQQNAANNFLSGTFVFASLPSAAANPYKLAITTDQGPAFSTGAIWELLYNPTIATLAISTNSPLTPAQTGSAYTNQLVATQGMAPYTWSLVSSFGSTDVWVVSSTGALTGTPTAAETDTLVIQVVDAAGASAQKALSLRTVGSLAPAATPTFAPAAGPYATTQTVTITCATGASTIFYTTNGSTPTTSSAVYSVPLTVSVTQTINAIATASGFTQSAVGSAAYTISAMTTAATQIKFNPGVYPQTTNVNDSGETSEIDVLASSFVATPALIGLSSWTIGSAIGANPIICGYSFWRSWPKVQPTTKNVYDFSSIDSVMAYLQLKMPGMRLIIGLRCYQNWFKVFGNAGPGTVPSYINQNATLYGAPNTGGSGSGWVLANYTNPQYQFAFANLSNANVMAEWNAVFGALGAHVCPTQYLGQSYTYNKHPLVEMFNDFTPDDVNMNGNPTTPSSWSVTNFQNNWKNRNAVMRALVPNTSVGFMPGFGAGTPAQQQSVVDSMAINGMALSCTDATTNVSNNNPNYSYSQHWEVGDQLTNTNPVTWSAGGGKNYCADGTTARMPTIQPLDFARGATPNTAAQVTNCMNICYNIYLASHVMPSMASSATYNPVHDWAGSNGYIAPAILALGGIPSANKRLPLTYMIGTPVTSIAVNSSSSLTPTWTALTGVGTGATYTLYRNGVIIQTGIALTTTSFIDTGLATATTYTYAVAMANSYGTGPKGSSLSATTS